MSRVVDPTEMACATGRELGHFARAHGWRASGFIELAWSEAPERIDETLHLTAPNGLEVWLFLYDIAADGVPVRWRWCPLRGSDHGPWQDDLQALRNLIRDLGHIDLTEVA